MKEIQKTQAKLFLEEHQNEVQPFRPIAFFNPNMDSIRIHFADCSVREHRVNEHITFLFANKASSGAMTQIVGLVIKGVNHLLESLGLPKNSVLRVADFLDSVVQTLPEVDSDTRHKIEQVQTTARMTQLTTRQCEKALAA